MTTNQIAKLRAKFIDDKRIALDYKVTAIQKKLFAAIFDKLINELDIADGKIVSNNKNIDLASSLDKIMKEFVTNDFSKVIALFSDDLIGLQALNKTYFTTLSKDRIKLDKISTQVDAIMKKRIGLKPDGTLIKKGYLDKLATDDKLKKQLKQNMYNAVTTGKGIEEFKKQTQTLIEGNKNVNGALQKHFNRFVYDTYQQFDRTTANLYADKLELQAFIYSGAKVAASRCFCVENKGKIFIRTEADKWRNKLNSKCGPIWDEDKDGTYRPLEMMGGYGCVDVPNFISDRMAIRMRPELSTSLS